MPQEPGLVQRISRGVDRYSVHEIVVKGGWCSVTATYGYARVSKSDDDAKNLDTQLRLLAHHGIREDLIFTDVTSGRTMNRPGWRDLMGPVQPGDTIVVAFLDRFSRNFRGRGPDPGGANRA